MSKLRRRHREVCVCILLGLNGKETSDRLGISRRTIEDYRRELLEAYDCRTQAQLVFKLFKAYA